MSLKWGDKNLAAKNVKKFSNKIKVKFNKRAHIKPEQRDTHFCFKQKKP